MADMTRAEAAAILNKLLVELIDEGSIIIRLGTPQSGALIRGAKELKEEPRGPGYNMQAGA